jgi:hypothetical protein
MFARRNLKVTSHIVGAAVEKHPMFAKETVQRGHEPSGHGQRWTPQYSMTPVGLLQGEMYALIILKTLLIRINRLPPEQKVAGSSPAGHATSTRFTANFGSAIEQKQLTSSLPGCREVKRISTRAERTDRERSACFRVAVPVTCSHAYCVRNQIRTLLNKENKPWL